TASFMARRAAPAWPAASPSTRRLPRRQPPTPPPAASRPAIRRSSIVVSVAKVTAGQDGWIVAHLDEGGKPGKVIGNTAVKKGENKNVVIKLSEDVPAGGKLWPMLHIDAGAIGTYEFPGPDAPVIVGGNIVMKQIAVTAAAAAAAQVASEAVNAAGQT